jgi:hypothetical protein
MDVPWNASWSSEDRYEIRPCRWAGGALAIWSPHSPGIGRPIFAKPHMVRQRQSIAKMLCTVCGKSTPENDRWWFGLGQYCEQWFMTTEAPVHKACADAALEKCPHLKRIAAASSLARFPGKYVILSAIVGGAITDDDFGVKINGRRVVGHLKIAWPRELIRAIRSGVAVQIAETAE